MRPVPEMDLPVASTLAQQALVGRAQPVQISRQHYLQRQAYALSLQEQAVAQCGVHVIDSTEVFCEGDVCHGAEDGQPWYWDDNHLNEFGNRRLIPLFERYFGNAAPSQ